MAAVMPKTMMAIKRRFRIAPFSYTHLARREDNARTAKKENEV
jgi:hypothetical protein